MKPFIHARSSAKRHGGKPEDYMAIHDFMDSSKSAVADVRHRCVLHSAFGVYLAERAFGTTIVNSDGREVSVRDIAEDHVIEDLGFIPSLDKWLGAMEIQEWMGGPSRKVRTFAFDADDTAATEPTTLADVFNQIPFQGAPLPPSAMFVD